MLLFLVPVDILNRILLAVVDEEEVKACLLLHVVFSVALPPGLFIEQHKIPEIIGSVSRSTLRKRVYFYPLQRIFLMSLIRGMDNLCLMLLDAGFPKNLGAPIYSRPPFKGSSREGSAMAPLQSPFPSFFHLALSCGRIRLVQAMLAKGGASPTAPWMGLTPLMLACCASSEKRALAMVKDLLAAKADPQVSIRMSRLRVLLRLRALLLGPGAAGKAPAVESTASHLSPPAVATLDAPDAIHTIDFAAASGHASVVAEILKHLRAKSGARTVLRDSRICLLLQSNVDITTQLLQAGANPAQVDHQGNTALHLAAAAGAVNVVAVLLRAGSDVDAIGHGGS